MHVILPDGSKKELADGASGADLAAAIGPGLARAALAVKVGGEVRDLARPLADGDEVAIVTNRDEDSLDLIRHDTAHVLAAAVLDLYPGTKISIGPPIEDGFYYDFEFPAGVTVSDADFEALEAKMREHIKAGEEFVREDVTPEAALERFRGEGQDYKVELIEDLVSANDLDTVSLYTNGPFTDLCRGPHAPATDRIKAFKLQSVAGAYWRGDADRQMLTRIYGTAFHSKQELDDHLERLEQARARDHRKLGRELGLFSFSELSPGSAFWPPARHGGLQRARRTLARDVARARLRGDQDAAALRRRAVEDLRPLGQVPRAHVRDGVRGQADGPQAHELPGALRVLRDGQALLQGAAAALRGARPAAPQRAQRHAARPAARPPLHPGRRPHLLHRGADRGGGPGLPRVRLRLVRHVRLRHVHRALDAARAAHRHRRDVGPRRGRAQGGARARRIDYVVNEGDGAFYGPKIDVHMRDSLGRGWQLGTIQLDYNFPERFDLTYTGADNAEHRPVMLHRALLGSFERFIGILLEHTAGELPLWLAPVQAAVLPLADPHNGYAAEVAAALRAGGLRAEVDDHTESVGRKIREAELRKVPYMLVVGDREAEERAVSLRRHGEGDLGTVGLDAAVERLAGEAAREGGD